MTLDSNPSADRRAKSIRRGRRAAALGMFMLCVAFFLPQVHGCKEDIVPYQSLKADPDFARSCLPFFAAAAMLVVYGVRALVPSERFRRALSAGVCLGTFALLFLGGMWLWPAILSNSSVSDPWWMLALCWGDVALLGAAALGALAVWALAPVEARIPACVAIGGACSLGYFLNYVNLAMWGLWVSVASSALVAGGAFWEARAAWSAHRLAVRTPAREGNA